jgi:predicted ATP-grasp superfamily ATP-dependent carboligase
VLVTDAHSTSALAVVRSLGARNVAVTVAGEKGRCNLAAYSRYTRRSILCAHAERQPLVFADQIARELESGYDLLIPTTDTTVTILRHLRERFERLVRIALPPNDALDTALDKLRTVIIASQNDVNVPRTFSCRTAAEIEDAARHLSYPCVVKPRFSRQWNDGAPLTRGTVRYATSAASLLAICREAPLEPPSLLVQELVSGTGLGVFVLADGGRPLAVFAHRRLREADPTGGRASLAESIAPDQRVVAPALRLISALGWHGVAMAEFKDPGDQQPPVLMEINGRFWGSLPLGIAAGIDFPSMLVDLLLGRAVSVRRSYRVGLRCRHLKGDLSYLAAALKGRPAYWTGAFPGPLAALAEIAPFPGRWRAYNFRMADPLPALYEAADFLKREMRSMVTRHNRTAGAHLLDLP